MTKDHECYVSMGIHECATFGSGELDKYGFWEFPCYKCAREYEAKHPEDGPCWPHTEAQKDLMGIRSLITGE